MGTRPIPLDDLFAPARAQGAVPLDDLFADQAPVHAQQPPGILDRIGHVLGYIRRPVDIAANYYAGRPDALNPNVEPTSIPELANQALLPERDAAAPRKIIAGTPLEAVPGLGLIGAIETMREQYPQAGEFAAGLARPAVGTAAGLASDPSMALGALGALGRTGKALETLLSAAFAGTMGKGAYDAAQATVERFRAEGITPKTVEEATNALLAAGGAALGGAGVAGNLRARGAAARARETAARESFFGREEAAAPPTGVELPEEPFTLPDQPLTDVFLGETAPAQARAGVPNTPQAMHERIERARQQRQYAYRARNVGESGIPSAGHSQASLSEADVRRIAPSRTEAPQEVVRVDLGRLAPEDFEVQAGPQGSPWVRFARELPEDMVERVGEVTELDRRAASKADPGLRSTVARAAPENLSRATGLPSEAVRKGVADVEADGVRELSPEAVAVKRAALELPNYPVEADVATTLEAMKRELGKGGVVEKGGLARNARGEVVGRSGAVSRKDAFQMTPEEFPESGKRIAEAIERDKGNPLFMRVQQHVRNLIEEHQGGTRTPSEIIEPEGPVDTSFEPAEFEGRPAAYEPTEAGMQGRLAGTTRPESAPTIRPEGRPGEGPLFTQERDAAVRAEGRSQQPLFDPSEAGAFRAAARDMVEFPATGERGAVLSYNQDGTATVRVGKETRTVGPKEVRFVGPEPLAGVHAQQAGPASEVDKLIGAVKGAKPIRKQQEELYTAERARRAEELGRVFEKPEGEATFHRASKALEGELPKADFEGVRGQLEQGEIDALYNRIATHENLDRFEKKRAGSALGKLLDDGRVPQENELALLEEVFGPKLVKALKPATLGDEIKSALNLPRALKSSIDLSAPLRQGFVLSGGHPVTASKAFVDMHRAALSEKVAGRFEAEIRHRPNAGLYKESGLYLAGRKLATALHAREEAFMSRLVEKIPGLREVVNASERAYTTYLNRLRADVFDSMLADAQKATGGKLSSADHAAIADFINKATGRGNLGPLNQSAPILNTAFFAPRFVASRFQVLDPRVYTRLPKGARQHALRSMGATMGLVTTALTLAKLGGAKVEADPRSSDFAKIRLGDTRVDLLAGEQQNIRLLAQLLSGQTKSVSGKKSSQTPADTLMRFGRSKLAPVPGAITDVLTEKTFTGDDVTVGGEAEQLFMPMFLQDVLETFGKDGHAELLPLGLYGASVTTYGQRVNREKEKRRYFYQLRQGAQ
jgi:hypothetical protein